MLYSKLSVMGVYCKHVGWHLYSIMDILCLIQACTMLNTRVHLTTHNGSACLHTRVSIHVHMHVCNVTFEQYHRYILCLFFL